ncbi:DUF3685 domain-containing protein [Cyanobium sp. WAJ14-Wanaka]|uniref:DUF3685 domain-containing protein n=1 Tax=Cyanobium sp. WAJ14-Wanaka TaxID=2823725 RepID=UPI0020CFA9B7|nr:DUF3685 domain-containing protein [Cyanobium sp. WAJ14-Wanaka]
MEVSTNVPSQLLLFAEPLLREGLVRLLERSAGDFKVVTAADQLEGAPKLVIWQAGANQHLENLGEELEALRLRWKPAPLLLLLASGHGHPTNNLLQLPVQGLLEAPETTTLLEALTTLLQGGRVVSLADGPLPECLPIPAGVGLGHRLLLGGLQQIDADLLACQRLLNPPPTGLVSLLVLQGRLRELASARQLLIVLWGPISSLVSAYPAALAPIPSRPTLGTQLTLAQPNASGIWQTLRSRLEAGVRTELANGSGQLLAIEGLTPQRRRDLLLALIEQCALLRERLLAENLHGQELQERWNGLQLELRQQALQTTVSPYVQLPYGGGMQSVAETLISSTELAGADPELPAPLAMLGALVHGNPLLTEGQLVAIDEPRAVLFLEQLLSNWLVRSAELVSAELLSCCSSWPELRRYLLQPNLLATRQLERLRNQLNAQQRWLNWYGRPVALYESRRNLFILQAKAIGTLSLTEPRDGELRQLGWLQQLVTLALESRDALAPQVQGLIKGLGDLLVVLLTQVMGRSIGLVGRGIRQGLARGQNGAN